ncbi:hypothetical protein AVDCRST_MAG84-5986, partial [uncultured Microcoleus sp.]
WQRKTNLKPHSKIQLATIALNLGSRSALLKIGKNQSSKNSICVWKSPPTSTTSN